MNELGPDARALLDVARDGDDPTQDDRARLRGSIGARLAIGAAAAGVALTAATSSSAGAAGASAGVVAAPIGIGMKLLLVVGAATAVGVGAVSYIDSSPPSQTAPAQTIARPSMSAIAQPRTTPIAKPPAVVVATASAAPEPSSSASSAATAAALPPVAATSSPTTSPSAIDREIGLVREALAAVQAGDGARALVLLDEHARRYPSGALSEEREATRVFALCSLGRVGEARAAADRFLRVFPRSVQAGRVRASCGGDGTSN